MHSSVNTQYKFSLCAAGRNPRGLYSTGALLWGIQEPKVAYVCKCAAEGGSLVHDVYCSVRELVARVLRRARHRGLQRAWREDDAVVALVKWLQAG